MMNKPVVKQAVITAVSGVSAPMVRPTRYAYGVLVWLTSLIFVLFQFFIQLSSAEIVTGLMRSFSLTAFGASVLASLYYYVYVALQTPAGMFIDRYGPRRLLTLGAFGISVGCYLFACSNSVWVAAIGRLLMGGAAACSFVGSLSLVRRWFPAKRFTLFAGIAEMFGMFGAIIGSIFLAKLIGKYGWHTSILGASVISLVLGACLWTIVRDDPYGRKYQGARSVKKTLLRDFTYLLHNKLAWINGLYSGLIFSVVTVFVALWAVDFLQTAYHISLVKATFLADMVFVGVALGSLVVGWVDTQFRCRRLILMSGALGASLLLLLIILLPVFSLAITTLFLILLGLCCSAYIVNFAVAGEIVPSGMQGASIGFTNALSVGTAPILQPLVGLILAKAALFHHAHLTGVFQVRDYQWALMLLPFCTLLAFALAFFIPERRKRQP